jgi:hypothetical protein
MPVIVLALHDKNVLIATGGKWYMDGKSDTDAEIIAESQRSRTTTNAADATREIQSAMPPNTLMKPVVKKPAYFTTKFVDKSRPNPPGFIKGTFPDKDFKNEKPKEAAAREFGEETFTKLPVGRFTEVSLGTKIYKVTLTDAEAKDVISNWSAKYKANIGELLDLKWVSIETAKTMSLNPESSTAVKYLPKSGGVFSVRLNKMVKTRSMTRRAARRSKSHCAGVKRSAVCKRTEGCKYASGTKRKFCRTAKNRKH